MAPRKSLRLKKAGKSRSDPSAASAAAAELYHCSDIRREILRLLDRKELASFMRVDKGGFEEAVKILYKEKTVNEVEFCLGSSLPRHVVYRSAVHTLKGNRLMVTELRGILERETPLPSGTRSEIYNMLVPDLQFQFPNIRRYIIPADIQYRYVKEKTRSESWTLHIDPLRVAGDVGSPVRDTGLIPPLRIDILHSLSCNFD